MQDAAVDVWQIARWDTGCQWVWAKIPGNAHVPRSVFSQARFERAPREMSCAPAVQGRAHSVPGAWGARHPVLPSLVNSQLSAETQNKHAPVPAARGVPGTVAGKSQPRGPAGSYCSPEHRAALQPVGWITWPAFLLRQRGQVWEVPVGSRSLQHRALLQGRADLAKGTGCGMGQSSASTDTLRRGVPTRGYQLSAELFPQQEYFLWLLFQCRFCKVSMTRKNKQQSNKTELESVIVWLWFSVSQASRTIPASGINKLTSCLAKVWSCSLIKYKVLQKFICSEGFAFHSAW